MEPELGEGNTGLAQRLQLSEASVKRMFSRGTFTLARIEEVLAAVELDLYEVARMCRGAISALSEIVLAMTPPMPKPEAPAAK